MTSDEYTDDFLTFWAAYPRKVAKGHAWRMWCKHADRPPLATLLACLAMSADDWQGKDAQFIPHPGTWLNSRRWEDEREEGREYRAPDAANGLDAGRPPPVSDPPDFSFPF